MPNAKVLSEKKAVVDALAGRLSESTSGVLVDYKGINVEEDTALRRELREAGIEYTVVKNTLLRFALKRLPVPMKSRHGVEVVRAQQSTVTCCGHIPLMSFCIEFQALCKTRDSRSPRLEGLQIIPKRLLLFLC